MAGTAPPRKQLNRRYRFHLAAQDDDADLRRLLREQPMAGNVQVTFEREPDFFAAGGLMGVQHQTLVARAHATGRVAGMGSRSIRAVYLNGTVEQAGYLSELRVAPEYRGRRDLFCQGYEQLRLLHEDGAAPYYLTSIVSDNEPARRLLEAGLPGLPTYTLLSAYHTLAMPTKRARVRSSEACVKGAEALREGISECLRRNYARYAWAPHWNDTELGSPERTPGLGLEDFVLTRAGDRVTGCMALWDQRGFRQIVVRGYGRPIARWRPLLNLGAHILGLPRLPECGKPWAYAYVSPTAVDDDDPALFALLLRATLRRAAEHGYDYVVLGLAAAHPLLNVARRLSRHREYTSRLYLVSWGPPPSQGTPNRSAIPHPEVALL